MADWWTEDNMMAVVREHINPNAQVEHCFQCVSFGASFYLTVITLGILSLFFVRRYIFAMTNSTIYFLEHSGQLNVQDVLEIKKFPYAELSIKIKGGILNNFVRFKSTTGWKVKMQFPKRKYKPNSTLSNWKEINAKLRSRCQQIS